MKILSSTSTTMCDDTTLTVYSVEYDGATHVVSVCVDKIKDVVVVTLWGSLDSVTSITGVTNEFTDDNNDPNARCLELLFKRVVVENL